MPTRRIARAIALAALALSATAHASSAQRPAPPAVTVAGAGATTFVLLTGMVGGVGSFGALEARLVAAGARVITIDPYQLSLDSADVTLQAMARRVDAVLRALDTPAIHLVGHSHGGGVALRLAADAPARVQSLHLLDVGALPGQGGPVFSSAIRLVPLIVRVPGGRRFVRDRLVRGLRDNSAAAGWLTPHVQARYTEPMLDHIDRVIAMARRLGASQEPEGVDQVVARVRAPVTVVLGAVATPAGPAPVEVAGLAPLGAMLRIERIASAAHFPHEERPDAVARTLLRDRARYVAARTGVAP